MGQAFSIRRVIAALATALAGMAGLPSAWGNVVVSYQPCDPPSKGGTEICAEHPRVVPTQAWFSGFGGSLVAGGYAGPAALGAYLQNTSGGNASVTTNFWDDYTLMGPPGDKTITFDVWLHLDGTWEHDHRFSSSAFNMGFLINSGAYWPAPASVGAVLPSGPGGEPVDLVAHRELSMKVGESVPLGFQLQISGNDETRLDFLSTLELSFPDLPAGYFIRSTQGFDGIGSQPAGNGVPLPSSLSLVLLGLAALGWAATRRRASAH